MQSRSLHLRRFRRMIWFVRFDSFIGQNSELLLIITVVPDGDVHGDVHGDVDGADELLATSPYISSQNTVLLHGIVVVDDDWFDAADNVPGVPGIGPKIAAQLLGEFGTLESLLENTDQIPQQKRREKLDANADLARISRQLVELESGLDWSQLQAFHPHDDIIEDKEGGRSIPTTMSDATKISELRMQPMNADRILAFYDEMGFFTLKQRLLGRLASQSKIGHGGNEGTINSSSSSSNGSIDNNNNGNNNRKFASTVASKSSSSSSSSSPIPSAASTAATATATQVEKPKAKTAKRNFWEKFERGIPKPEEYEDVPFWQKDSLLLF